METKAVQINLTEAQRGMLEKIIRGHKSSQAMVNRSKIILEAASGLNNLQICRKLKLNNHTVINWRKKWKAAEEALSEVESTGRNNELNSLINQTLSDNPRSGHPTEFTEEQVVQLISVACESPLKSGYPFGHWTHESLRQEVIKRGIFKEISKSSITRFLKRSKIKAT